MTAPILMSIYRGIVEAGLAPKDRPATTPVRRGAKAPARKRGWRWT